MDKGICPNKMKISHRHYWSVIALRLQKGLRKEDARVGIYKELFIT